MIRERVAVGQTPTEVVVGWSRCAVFVENTGSVDVFVDVSQEALEADGPAGGLRVQPGEKLTVPRDGAGELYAAVVDGAGELTCYLPGWQ